MLPITPYFHQNLNKDALTNLTEIRKQVVGHLKSQNKVNQKEERFIFGKQSYDTSYH